MACVKSIKKEIVFSKKFYRDNEPKFYSDNKFYKPRIVRTKHYLSSNRIGYRFKRNFHSKFIQRDILIKQLKLKEVDNYADKSTITESTSAKSEYGLLNSKWKSNSMAECMEKSTDTESTSELEIDHSLKLNAISNTILSDFHTYNLWKDHIQLTVPFIAQILPSVTENMISNSLIDGCCSCEGNKLQVLCSVQRKLFFQQYQLVENYLRLINEYGMLQVPGMAAAKCLHPLIENMVTMEIKSRQIHSN